MIVHFYNIRHLGHFMFVCDVVELQNTVSVRGLLDDQADGIDFLS